MARHLLEIQARTRLSIGKSIAQFLSYQDEADYTILKWLVIWKGGDDKEYTVNCHEVYDEGSEDDLDISEFSSIDPENLFDGIANEFDTVEEALSFAAIQYGAVGDKYVAESMMDEEYADYMKTRNTKTD